MSTLTSSATLSVSAGATVTESVSTIVAPALGYGAGGTGRLIHPTLGTYDYQVAPTEWVNLIGDVIVAPIWSNNLTLSGASNALWAGTIKDVEAEEYWDNTAGLSMPTAQFAMLASMFQSPPDPASAWVLWYPNYATALGYKVLLTELIVESTRSGRSDAVALDAFSLAGVVAGAVTLKLRLIGRA